jgi:hypothetical protein
VRCVAAAGAERLRNITVNSSHGHDFKY